MAKRVDLPKPQVKKRISSEELAAEAPDAEKEPARTDENGDPRSPLQRITGKWPANNF